MGLLIVKLILPFATIQSPFLVVVASCINITKESKESHTSKQRYGIVHDRFLIPWMRKEHLGADKIDDIKLRKAICFFSKIRNIVRTPRHHGIIIRAPIKLKMSRGLSNSCLELQLIHRHPSSNLRMIWHKLSQVNEMTLIVALILVRSCPYLLLYSYFTNLVDHKRGNILMSLFFFCLSKEVLIKLLYYQKHERVSSFDFFTFGLRIIRLKWQQFFLD